MGIFIKSTNQIRKVKALSWTGRLKVLANFTSEIHGIPLHRLILRERQQPMRISAEARLDDRVNVKGEGDPAVGAWFLDQHSKVELAGQTGPLQIVLFE